MYPAYDAVADLQEEKEAKRSIHFALEAEKIHEVMYRDAGEIVSAGNDIEQDTVLICPICGHTVFNEAPDRCPVCGAKKDQYHKFVAG